MNSRCWCCALLLPLLLSFAACLHVSSPLSLTPTQSLALSLSLGSFLCCLILWRTHKNAIRLNAKLIKATWATKPINPTHLPRPPRSALASDCTLRANASRTNWNNWNNQHNSHVGVAFGDWLLRLAALTRGGEEGGEVVCLQALQPPQHVTTAPLLLPTTPLWHCCCARQGFGLGCSKLIYAAHAAYA